MLDNGNSYRQMRRELASQRLAVRSMSAEAIQAWLEGEEAPTYMDLVLWRRLELPYLRTTDERVDWVLERMR